MYVQQPLCICRYADVRLSWPCMLMLQNQQKREKMLEITLYLESLGSNEVLYTICLPPWCPGCLESDVDKSPAHVYKTIQKHYCFCSACEAASTAADCAGHVTQSLRVVYPLPYYKRKLGALVDLKT